jgi:hypothetical protein
MFGLNFTFFSLASIWDRTDNPSLNNEGQPVSIRGLVSENAAPALGTDGTLLLIEATITGLPGAENSPALINYNHGRVFLRDVRTTGYGRALADMQTPDFAAAWRVTGEDKPGSLGPQVAEYSSERATISLPMSRVRNRRTTRLPPCFLARHGTRTVQCELQYRSRVSITFPSRRTTWQLGCPELAIRQGFHNDSPSIPYLDPSFASVRLVVSHRRGPGRRHGDGEDRSRQQGLHPRSLR